MSKHTPGQFMEYFRRNYPGPNTIIFSPDWHAPKIYAAAIAASAYGELLEACKSIFPIVNNRMIGCGAATSDPEIYTALVKALDLMSSAIEKAEEGQ